MITRGGLVVALSAFLLAVFLGAGLLLTNLSIDSPSRAEVLEDGFAMWPADTLEEAEAECPRSFVSSWRHSPEDTTERFATEVLGLDGPSVGRSRSDGADAVVVQITAPGVPLYHFTRLRRAGPCWYVTDVANRESSCCLGSVGYAGNGSDRLLFLHVRGVGVMVSGELGWGERLERFTELDFDGEPTTQLTIPAPTGARAAGHYYLSFLGRDPGGVPDVVEGGVFGAPGDPATGVRPPGPVDVRRSVLEAARKQRECDHGPAWQAGARRRLAVGSTLGFALQEGPGGNSREGFDPRRIELSSHGDVVVTADEARARFDFWRIRDGCRMLGRIEPLGSEQGVRSLLMVGDDIWFDLDWGRATEVLLDFQFGSLDGGRALVSRIEGPVILDGTRADRPEQSGSYTAFFYMGSRLVSMEGAALPPIEDFVPAGR